MRRLFRKHAVSPAGSLNFTQNTPIYSRKTPLNCYHGGYIYRLISWLLRRLLCGQQVGLNNIILKNNYGGSWSLRETIFYHKDIYVKVDIRTNKPLNVRLRLSCRLRYRYRPQTRYYSQVRPHWKNENAF